MITVARFDQSNVSLTERIKRSKKGNLVVYVILERKSFGKVVKMNQSRPQNEQL